MGVKTFSKDFLFYASLGHKSEAVDPKAYANLLGFRNNTSVLNIEKTRESLFLTSMFLKSVFTKKKGKASVLFLNLNEESNVVTKACAFKSVQPFLVKNWFSGALTNVLLKDKVDVIFLLSSKNNNFVLQEAQKLNIPVIALVDSDTSSNMVTFPILTNDNSLELQHFVTKFISDTIIETQLMTYGLGCV